MTLGSDIRPWRQQRRRLLSAAVAAVPLLGVRDAVAKAATPAHDALGNEPLSLSDAELLQTFVRLRGSTDGSVTAGWLESQRYAVVGGEAVPLCRVLAGALSRFERKGEGLYEATILEVTHYLDFESGALLDTLKMPFSGRVVKVPPYRFGPIKVRFAVKLDERESFSPKAEGKGSENFAPLGEVRLRRAIGDVRRTGDRVFVRHQEHGTLTPLAAGVLPVSYREWTIWNGPASIALDPGASYCPCECSYTAMTSWRPWMQMEGIEGHTLDSGRGGKVRRFTELPQEYLALTERLHPDVIRDPESALAMK